MDKKLSIYLVCVMLFVVYIISVNVLIEAHTTEIHFQKDNLENYTSTTDVYYSIGSLDIIQFNGQSYFDGWAFASNSHPNDDRNMKLILSSNEHTYSLQIDDMYARQDVVNEYKNEYFHTSDVGFRAIFYTFFIPDGIYDLYMYVWENETNYGIVKTKQQFEKKGKDFFEIDATENTPITLTELPPSDGVTELFSIDSILKNENTYNFYGWIANDNLDSSEQKITLVAESGDGEITQFELNQMERTDVAEFFNTDKYLHSGYSATISTEYFLDDEYTLTFYVENGGTIKRSPSIYFNSQNTTYEIIN